MKKVLFELILTLVLPLACLRGNAQSLYVGGSFSLAASDSYNSYSGSLQNAFNFSVAPDFGWEFKEKLAAGQADHYDNSELHSVSFGFDATSKDIFGDLSDITVGFLYHF